MYEQQNNDIKQIEKFPFQRVLSLEFLIEFWEDASNCMGQIFAAPLLEELKSAPELRKPIKDLSILEKHKVLLDSLMTVIYPVAVQHKTMAVSIIPLSFKGFYSSPLFDKIFNFNEDIFRNQFVVEKIGWDSVKIIKAYSFILKECYDVKIQSETQMAFIFPDKENKLDRHFHFDIDMKFLKIKVNGEKPKLSQNDIKKLMDNPTDLKIWMNKLPPEKFELHGFTTINATEVTSQEVLSSLKHILLEKESMSSKISINEIEHKMRSYFNNPDLKLGLASLRKDKEIFTYSNKIGSSFVICDDMKFTCADYGESIYSKAAKQKHPIIIEDLGKYKDSSTIEKYIHKKGIKNLIVAPLFDNDQLIGFFEIGSPNSGDITHYDHIKLKELIILFATAVKRSLEEFNNEIRNLIKEEFTAIHPAVEWRFERAALNLIEKRKVEKNAQMEPIIFENVFPLYGVSDIRDSSIHRNDAIQTDLVEHLRLAQKIMKKATELKPIPILEEMNFRIVEFIKSVKRGLNSGDEITVLEFLNFEVADLFEFLSKTDNGLKETIENYNSSLDPNLNSLYVKRKEYESSVAQINETISSHIENKQEKAQKMFPHYFEKYKTDGIEHSIYIGASLTEELEYDTLYLRNLRLLQLITFCEIVRKSDTLKSELKIKLETAHLILVQNTPLTIRFRVDEKKFDVDGTYNLRYEIMKKRIDKAQIKGTSERLTQPGKIAIVYSQDKEAKEYLIYIKYLQSKKYLLNKVENLELDSMQGVLGLKALRVSVNISETESSTKIDDIEVKDVVRKFLEV
ncbi:MAG: GAF domain-containing protein [Ignavibacteriae bacterium]|nr:GAF domain-containing protein [Ignavibacteriota bacterium]